MASVFTQIADIVDPVSFAATSIQRTTALNAFLSSGIVAADAQFDALAGQGGTTHEMPFFEDIEVDALPVDDVPANKIESHKIGMKSDVAALQFRAISIGKADVSADVAGADPMDVAISGDAKRWARNFQKISLATLDGVFGTALADHVVDVAVEDGLASGVKISATAVLDAKGVLGDRQDDLSIIVLHSDVYRSLQKANLIAYIPNARGEISIPTYLGLRVVVDDGMAKVAAGTSGHKYTSILARPGVIALGQAAPANGLPVEFVRDAKGANGGGVTEMISRRKFLVHVRGVKWAGNPAGLFPTNAELATAGNYQKVWDSKYLGLVKLVTNG